MKYALVNPNWDFKGSTYFGCQDPHYPLELLFAFDKTRRSRTRSAAHRCAERRTEYGGSRRRAWMRLRRTFWSSRQRRRICFGAVRRRSESPEAMVRGAWREGSEGCDWAAYFGDSGGRHAQDADAMSAMRGEPDQTLPPAGDQAVERD